MIFSHYSKTPVGVLLECAQQSQFGMKPTGLWVSVDGEDDWPEWCQRESYDGCGSYHYRVILDVAHVLVIDTNAALREFDTWWRCEFNGDSYLTYIDWVGMAREYAGILIAPYQWDARLDLIWYYGWDCASGCIWDPAAVIGLEQMPPTTNADNRTRSTP